MDPLQRAHDGRTSCLARVGAEILNAMTVDVEEHFQVTAFDGFVPREDWDAIPSRVEDNTIRLLDLFDEHDVKSTFFVLGWVGERHPRLLRRIAAAGHEVGCHGYSHRLIYDQTPADFRSELSLARRILQDASGHLVDGHRAASFSIQRRNLWALDIVVEAGFSYDSSLFPVLHDRYGIPGAPRGLYRLNTPSGGELVEAPPATVVLGGMVLAVGGGGYLRLYPKFLFDWAIRRLNRAERMSAILYVHPWEVDPTQPRVHGVPWSRSFRHYLNLDETLGKLRHLVRSHRFAPLGEVIRAAGPLPLTRLG